MEKHKKLRTPAGNAFNQLTLETFHFYGMLIAAGDEVVREFGLTSSLWQVLGAGVASDTGPLTVAQIARNMGLTRQSVRRSAKILERKGLITFEENPDHKRARLVKPTPQGLEVLDAIMIAHAEWVNRIAQEEDAQAIDDVVRLMRRLAARL